MGIVDTTVSAVNLGGTNSRRYVQKQLPRFDRRFSTLKRTFKKNVSLAPNIDNEPQKWHSDEIDVPSVCEAYRRNILECWQEDDYSFSQVDDLLGEATISSPTHDVELPPLWCCSTTYIPPNVQYLVASLCDADYEFKLPQDLRLRCPYATEVSQLLTELRNYRFVDASTYPPSVYLTVLRELLRMIDGGIYRDTVEAFNAIIHDDSMRSTVVSLQGYDEVLYLAEYGAHNCYDAVCCEELCMSCLPDAEAYTELLLTFTYVLFPHTLGDLEKFVKFARLLLIMIDFHEMVFEGYDYVDRNGNLLSLDDDDNFFSEIMSYLSHLEDETRRPDDSVKLLSISSKTNGNCSITAEVTPPSFLRTEFSNHIRSFYQLAFV